MYAYTCVRQAGIHCRQVGRQPVLLSGGDLGNFKLMLSEASWLIQNFHNILNNKKGSGVHFGLASPQPRLPLSQSVPRT